jgi:uncharacterized membrane protein YoaT (DUF817 family)
LNAWPLWRVGKVIKAKPLLDVSPNPLMHTRFQKVRTQLEAYEPRSGLRAWIYAEDSFLKIGAVPLFSGFMYAAVGSYIVRIWRIFDFRFSGYPSAWSSIILAIAIYINFFAHHWLPDIRNLLFVITFILFWKCKIWFKAWREYRWMPLLFGWLLVALFIWFAENIGTFANAWTYPSQKKG